MDKQDFLKHLVKADIKEVGSGVVAHYAFNNDRINASYVSSVKRYSHIVDSDDIFSECCEILLNLLGKMDVDVITEKDTQYLAITLRQRLCDYINTLNNVVEERRDGQRTLYTPEIVSLDVFTRDDDNVTLHDSVTECSSIFYTDKNEEGDGISVIMEDARLTKRQKEVVTTLTETESTSNGIYNQTEAASLLDCSRKNVNKIYKAASNKIKSTYSRRDRREELIGELEDFIDGIESESNVMDFIVENKNIEYIEYLLYSTDVCRDLVRKLNKEMLTEDEVRKFCTQFLKQMYVYLDLLKINKKMSDRAHLKVQRNDAIKVTRPKKDFVDSTVYSYVREDKCFLQFKRNESQIIDGEKYYLVSESGKKTPEVVENKTIYKQLSI